MKAVIIILIAAMVMIACAPEPTPAPKIQEPKVGAPVIKSEVPPPIATVEIKDDIADEPEIEKPTLDISTEMAAFLNKIDKIKNYWYQTPTGKINVDAENELMLIEYQIGFKQAGLNFDYALINTKDKTAKAWCVKRACVKEQRERIYTVNYEDYFDIETPTSFQKSFTGARTIPGKTRIIQNSESVQVEFVNSKGAGTAWLHTFFAVPLEYTMDDSDHSFQDISLNPPLWKPLTTPSNYNEE